MTDEIPWRVEVTSAAARQLRRLPTKVATAIIEFITGALADNPLRLSKPLHHELADYWAARRGDYRVLIRADAASRVVLVVHIDHRANVYRQR